MLYAINDDNTDQDVIARDTFRTLTRLYMMINSDKKLQQLPHKNDITNILAAMIQVVPNFPSHHMLPYGQGSLSADLSESQYCC